MKRVYISLSDETYEELRKQAFLHMVQPGTLASKKVASSVASDGIRSKSKATQKPNGELLFHGPLGMTTAVWKTDTGVGIRQELDRLIERVGLDGKQFDAVAEMMGYVKRKV